MKTINDNTDQFTRDEDTDQSIMFILTWAIACLMLLVAAMVNP